jgi:CRP-like cAMP-binding protein
MAGKSLFVIRSGSVKISKMLGEGDERTLAVLGPGDCFGEMALVDGGPRSTSAVVVKKAEVLTLDKKDFQALCDGNPKLGYRLTINLTRVMVKRFRGAQDKLQAALEYALKRGAAAEKGASLDVPIS